MAGLGATSVELTVLHSLIPDISVIRGKHLGHDSRAHESG